MNPIVGPRLAEIEAFAQQGLQWIHFLIDQCKQQLLFQKIQSALPSSTRLAFARFARPCLVSWVFSGIYGLTGRQQQLKVGRSQTR